MLRNLKQFDEIIRYDIELYTNKKCFIIVDVHHLIKLFQLFFEYKPGFCFVYSSNAANGPYTDEH